MRAALSCALLLLSTASHALSVSSRVAQPRLSSRPLTAAAVRLTAAVNDEEGEPDWVLPAAVAGVGLAAAVHAPAFANLASQWTAVSTQASGDAFWAPVQFWAFFAAMHPLLKPAVWIGEVLHSSPGPQLGELLPLTFVAGNALVVFLLVTQSRFRTALNASLLALFIHSVGCGLEGSGLSLIHI